jgi:GNAT superfamily N-acetyltransferase
MMPAKAETVPEMEFHPVDRDRWPDLVRLFEHHGNPGYCWCMRWRAPSRAFNDLKTAGRKEALHRLVQAGTPVGVLGYINGEPAGWCSIAPRETYTALARSRVLRVLQRSDGQPVWAVVCFFLDRSVRGRGFMLKLLQAAVEFARSQGAAAVEGYPMEHPTGSYRWMGSPALFRRAGFFEAGRPGGGRLHMRYEFQEPGLSSVPPVQSPKAGLP